MAVDQVSNQSGLINDPAASGINQYCSVFHFTQLPIANQGLS